MSNFATHVRQGDSASNSGGGGGQEGAWVEDSLQIGMQERFRIIGIVSLWQILRMAERLTMIMT
jgi:hypothetical protein